MKLYVLALTAALLVSLSPSTYAQGGGCRSGGGPRPSMGMPGTEGASAFRVTLTNPMESARQYMVQLQQQELARTYYLQMQETARQEARRVAEEKEEKRQEKIAAIKERRAAELAKREAAKARNLARRKSSDTDADTSHKSASLR